MVLNIDDNGLLRPKYRIQSPIDQKQNLRALLSHRSGFTSRPSYRIDRHRKDLLLQAVNCWQQRIRTFSQGKHFASLTMHNTHGCNNLLGRDLHVHIHPVREENAFGIQLRRMTILLFRRIIMHNKSDRTPCIPILFIP